MANHFGGRKRTEPAAGAVVGTAREARQETGGKKVERKKILPEPAQLKKPVPPKKKKFARPALRKSR